MLRSVLVVFKFENDRELITTLLGVRKLLLWYKALLERTVLLWLVTSTL